LHDSQTDEITTMDGATFKRIRTESGYSQSEICRVLRISDKRTIRRWEHGDFPVSGPASIIMELLDSERLPRKYMQAGEYI
jgi:DNA-binding transcriptional regulator YiaG